MTQRKKVSDATQAEVLVKSRRRCCICFGLNRDDSIKRGQIAHVDKDSSNSVEDNLVFLCFDHHDGFDSTTRQSKNLTQAEVKAYRDELYQNFAAWRMTSRSVGMLNLLAASMDAEFVASTLYKVGR